MSKRMWMAALVVAVVSSAGAQQARESQARDEALLRQYIIESGEAFNNHDLDGMMARISPDLVLSYPGIPDMGYAELKKAYEEMIALPPGMSIKTSPTIEDVIVSGSLGAVRVTWTTTRTDQNSGTTVRRMRDMQIWRRDADGEWRFLRGMHYRDSPPTPPSQTTKP